MQETRKNHILSVPYGLRGKGHSLLGRYSLIELSNRIVQIAGCCPR